MPEPNETELEGGAEEVKPDDAVVGEVEETPPSATIPVDALPEELRSLPPDQLRRTLDNLGMALQYSNKERDDLRQRIHDIESRESRTPAAPKEPEKSIKDMLYEDPERAVDILLERKLAARLSSMDHLSNEVGTTQRMLMRNEYEDFAELEPDIDRIIRATGVTPTRENLRGAYLMALGNQADTNRRRKKNATLNPEKPKPDANNKKKAELTSLEREIARGMRISEDDYAKWREQEYPEFDVPTGVKK